MIKETKPAKDFLLFPAYTAGSAKKRINLRFNHERHVEPKVRKHEILL
ncbi:hypothetical protein FACS1894163_12230 [Spirochaetia bacterium]|nr:hypothetical protein FACS1894163_12230 [Spirochaetia bacterium]